MLVMVAGGDVLRDTHDSSGMASFPLTFKEHPRLDQQPFHRAVGFHQPVLLPAPTVGSNRIPRQRNRSGNTLSVIRVKTPRHFRKRTFPAAPKMLPRSLVTFQQVSLDVVDKRPQGPRLDRLPKPF